MLLPRVRRLLAPVVTSGAVLVALGLSGCGTTREELSDSAEAVYRDAKVDVENGAYDAAIRKLNRVEALGGGTLLTQQAQLDLAYVQWRSGERDAAIATLDRFIRFNPSSPAFDYALYLRGLVNFNDDLGLFGRLAGQNLSERDQQASRDAWQSFRQLVERFPESRYAPDARVRMDYIVNALAEHELHVARYYLRRGAYVAAANRAKRAVEDFQTSPAAEEALYILSLSYERLDLPELSASARRVLQASFPDSRFLSEGLRPPDRAWWRFW